MAPDIGGAGQDGDHDIVGPCQGHGAIQCCLDPGGIATLVYQPLDRAAGESSRSGLISIRQIVAPSNLGKVNTSRTSVRVNPKLPPQ